MKQPEDELKFLYDKMAHEFLERTRNQDFPRPEAIVAMKDNIPVVNGRRTPDECDVLTTYIPLTTSGIQEVLTQYVKEVKKIFHSNVDYYRTLPEAFHISLVMLHDVRPVDMDNAALRQAVLSDQRIAKAKAQIALAIDNSDISSYKIRLYGIRFSASDGAMMAMFIDNGETRQLRRIIGEAVNEHLNRSLLQYDKPFIHITLLRPLSAIPDDTLRALRRKQRELLLLTDANITVQVNSIVLGRERRWMHEEVNVIERFDLPGLD